MYLVTFSAGSDLLGEIRAGYTLREYSASEADSYSFPKILQKYENLCEPVLGVVAPIFIT